uniref:Small basic protein VP2 n=1 Tax=Sapovirus swine/WG214D/2009/USA TaxID=1304602 RepID=M4Q477_9CALI|nr:small basic protein VP2 [Sapovirus swine/WG214D/2009/USA]
MSWMIGALQTLGGLTDVANTISGIVYQQRQLDLLQQQTQLQAEWMRRNEQLQRDSLALSRELSTEGPTLRFQSALAAGFNPVDARRLAGSGERVVRGYLDQPVFHQGDLVGLRATSHLNTMNAALTTFKQGHPLGTGSPPKPTTGTPQPQGFANPNYQPRPPGLTLQGTSSSSKV